MSLDYWVFCCPFKFCTEGWVLLVPGLPHLPDPAQETENRRESLSDKGYHCKPTANIVANGEKKKTQKTGCFCLRIKTKVSGMSCLTTSTLITLEILASPVRPEKQIKGIQIGKAEIKLSLFIDDKIIYVENAKEAAKMRRKMQRYQN